MNVNAKEKAWLKARQKGIGASDAAAAIGRSKRKTNVQLWEEKTGRVLPADISSKPTVNYGKSAEKYLRELFALDYPEYKVGYDQYGLIANCRDAPWAFATLDGELTKRSTGEKGILEIKTAEIRTGAQAKQWKDAIPETYFIQVLHQLLATGYQFAILKAQLKYFSGEELDFIRIVHFLFLRNDYLQDIEELKVGEKRFWDCVQSDKRPNLILPEI